MKKLVSALIAIAFSLVTASSFAADTVAPAEPAAVPAKTHKHMKKHIVRKHKHLHKKVHHRHVRATPASN